MQPLDLPPFRRRTRQKRQYDVYGIEHDAPRPRFLDLSLESGKHPAEIEISRVDQVGHRLGVQKRQFLSPQLPQFPAETLRIGHDARRGFLKGDKDARLSAVLRTVHQELQREYGL